MSDLTPPQENVVADRGIPSLDSPIGGNRRQKRSITMALVVGVLVLAVGVAIALLSKKVTALRHQAQEKSQARVENTGVHLKPLDPSDFDKTPLPPSAQSSASPAQGGNARGQMSPGVAQATRETQRTGSGQPGQNGLTPEQQAALQAQAKQEKINDANPLAYGKASGSSGHDSAGPVDLGSGGGSAVDQSTRAVISAMQAQADANKKPENSGATLATSLKSTSTPGTNATLLNDPSLTMTQGTILTCSLEQALNSTVPGMTHCFLTDDVYSSDGRTKLAERGSELDGQYESGSLKSGMNRIFILWTRLRTPFGVIVDLDSPATDALGRSGVDGIIDNHFWQRFGAGLLLSVVDDVTASEMNKSTGTQSIQFSNTAQEGNNAASIALQHSIDIPPTLSKNQGDVVKVFVARDLFFGNVYGFRTAQR